MVRASCGRQLVCVIFDILQNWKVASAVGPRNLSSHKSDAAFYRMDGEDPETLH